jgi:hypothetical protein
MIFVFPNDSKMGSREKVFQRKSLTALRQTIVEAKRLQAHMADGSANLPF